MTDLTERVLETDGPSRALAAGHADTFRQAFRELASGVAVITFDVDGALHGFTATSLTSVSMAPPLALFCLSNRSRSRGHLRHGQRVGISVLGAKQADVATAFAATTPEGGYDDVAVEHFDGSPVIAWSLATLVADLVQCHPAGDATIWVCSLRSARIGTPNEPLLYHARGYWGRRQLGVPNTQ